MPEEDPVVRSARREALAAFVVWLLAMTYTVGCCYFLGYARDPATIHFIWGVPEWVLWGVVAPWSACTVIAGLFAYFVADGDLGEDPEGSSDDPLGRSEGGDG